MRSKQTKNRRETEERNRKLGESQTQRVNETRRRKQCFDKYKMGSEKKKIKQKNPRKQ